MPTPPSNSGPSSGTPRAPWWKGRRGEWYVVIQLFLFGLVVFGPRRLDSWPEWPGPLQRIAQLAGGALLLAGALLTFSGLFRLGPNLTPLPYPKEGGRLIESGPYRLVRHPIYSGGILMAVGWGLWVHGGLTLVYAAILFVFFDLKARKEERWLRERFEGYPAYCRKVRKLLPFIY